MLCFLKRFRSFIKINKRVITLLFAVVLIIPFVAVGAAPEGGESYDKMARPAASEVQNMTLIIGSHMIALSSLTEELNEIAENSARESSQNKIYYKSELSDARRGEEDNRGEWYEIQSANELSNISSNGTIVGDNVIDSLDLKYYTNSAGVTYELTTGKEVDIFDIDDVYNVASMKELESLKLEYDAKKDGVTPSGDGEEDKTKSDAEKIKNSLESVLNLDVHDKETDNVDLELDALKKYNDYLVQKGASDTEKQKVSEIRGAKAAERKSIIVDKVIDKMNEESKTNEGLAKSYGDAIGELTKVKPELDSKKAILVANENSPLFSKKETSLANDLVNKTKGNNYQVADEILKDLLAIDDLSEDIISDRERQISLLDQMISEAKGNYNSLVSSGESDEYRQAEGLNESVAKLDYIKKQYQDSLNNAGSEVELLLDKKIKLLNDLDLSQVLLESEIEDITQKIGEISSNSDGDEFKKIALNNLENMRTNLDEKLETIIGQMEMDDSSLKNEEKMNELRLAYQTALDKNDLAKAKSIKSEMDQLQSAIDKKNKGVESKIKDLEKQLSQIQKELNKSGISGAEKSALEKQKASVKTSITKLGASASSKGSAATKKTTASNTTTSTKKAATKKTVDTAKKTATKTLSKTSLTDADIKEVKKSISDIKSVSKDQPLAASNALGEISSQVKDKITSEEAVPASLIDIDEEIDEAIDDCETMIENGSDGEILDKEQIEEIASVFASDNELGETSKKFLMLGALDELLSESGEDSDNMSIDDITDEQKVIKKKMDEVFYSLVESDQGNLDNTGIILIDKKVKNGELYAPVQDVCRLLGMRYVWNVNLVEGWLIGTGRKYSFTQGKNTIVSENVKNRVMTNEAVFEPDRTKSESELWVPQSFWMDELEVTIKDIATKNKSLVYTSKAYELMKELAENLRQ